MKKVAAKDENAFVQFLKENQVPARGAFCILGCAAAETCEQIRAGGKGMLCSHYYALGYNFHTKFLIICLKFTCNDIRIVFDTGQRVEKTERYQNYFSNSLYHLSFAFHFLQTMRKVA